VQELQVSPPVDRISYGAAQELTYRPVTRGEQFGPLWATYRFKAKATVPPEWRGQRVDLLWVSHSEATLWINGRSMQGLNHEPVSWDHSVRPDALLVEKARGGETIEFEIEMGCNRVMGEGMEASYKTISKFVLDQCDIALFDAEAWQLYFDFAVLQMLEAEGARGAKDLDQTWAGELLAQLNHIANILDPDDRSTWDEAHRILQELYRHRNATLVHELSAIGHAHIDTAWLWPLAETYRKCVRSFSSQLAYMERYPDFKFACSQAQQYQWIKERNPEMYERIRKRVKSGHWVPLGGTWIEPDCNIPSGEALARQFLYGQRFFQQEFGLTCREFWNPDVFGYNGQLPQIMRLAGITRFLTQKLSWNRFNKPYHHTFTWQGIDGSEVLTHFPPADNYNAFAPYGGKNEITWLRDNARDYKDHDRSRHSLMLFGYGDGGGGPTPRMLEVLRRVEDLQGVPRTKMRSSDEFFTLLEEDCTDRPTMVGELYFEYHRGTYTTQAAVKKGNRKGEFLLHDIEFLATAARLKGATYPKEELDRLWKLLLLNQFHDILPGSSITLVYDDAARDYAEIQQTGEALRTAALRALTGGGADETARVPVNTIGFARREVAALPNGELAFVEASSYGIGQITKAPDSVQVTREGNHITLENAHLRAVLAEDGSLVSLIEKSSGREALSAPGNRFEIYDDHPTDFDAWDVDPFHLETRQDCPPATSCDVRPASPLRAEVVFERTVGASSHLRQTVRLDANAHRLEFHTHIDWHESHKMLKVAFPVNVHAMNASYEMQFGCVERPTHYTTFYDLAKYEVPGHKWADLSEHGFGVALLTESKYGFSTYSDTMRLSLLRAPKYPDPQADMGEHDFVYAVLPHSGGWREAGVVAEAYRFNAPILWTAGVAQPQSLASCDDPNLVLDTIKQAEDSDSIVLRLHECHGARGTARIHCALPFDKAVFCNILEEDGEAATVNDGVIEVPYRPFQIISIKM
ncbi:MAG: alpha-mannosidase, partial [Armatimonadota bacterium]|nr:alpha-mannosidase [Armatimonadota bacterium]